MWNYLTLRLICLTRLHNRQKKRKAVEAESSRPKAKAHKAPTKPLQTDPGSGADGSDMDVDSNHDARYISLRLQMAILDFINFSLESESQLVTRRNLRDTETTIPRWVATSKASRRQAKGTSVEVRVNQRRGEGRTENDCWEGLIQSIYFAIHI